MVPTAPTVPTDLIGNEQEMEEDAPGMPANVTGLQCLKSRKFINKGIKPTKPDPPKQYFISDGLKGEEKLPMIFLQVMQLLPQACCFPLPDLSKNEKRQKAEEQIKKILMIKSWMHLCTERYMKKKKRLQDQFLQKREEILKKYEAKIHELDAQSSTPRKKTKANSSGDESSRRGV
ncbi:hypothetical protein KFK09_008951 [Dendrobium nobile]|uniref:Uncharacterized protein n=1 Tax=Dendrobium nobile TaxID=94219 RepID=A0A8T3BP50_DENNO|nr:hypothetical protein KFK09_008951 [Dendrobium nobile]